MHGSLMGMSLFYPWAMLSVARGALGNAPKNLLGKLKHFRTTNLMHKIPFLSEIKDDFKLISPYTLLLLQPQWKQSAVPDKSCV